MAELGMNIHLHPFCRLLTRAIVIAALVTGCAQQGKDPKAKSAVISTGLMKPVELGDAVTPLAGGEGQSVTVSLAAAKNETTDFALQIRTPASKSGKNVYSLRIHQLELQTVKGNIGVENLSAYRVLSMPIDTNRAGYVRHTGLSISNQRPPRALLPANVDNGLINLSALPGKSVDNDPPVLWIDLHIPPETPAGDYESTCDLLEGGNPKPIDSIALKLSVYDFVLPDERHLLTVGQLSWPSLQRLYADRFEAVTPRLMNRKDSRYAPALRVLDRVVTLAQTHRANIVVPRLQPTVKWPAGKPPQVDWDDFDGVVAPWLSGEMFADHVPLGFWPLPEVDFLDRFDRKSQLDYWSDASSHFDGRDWLGRTSVEISKSTPGRARGTETMAFSAEAGQVLGLSPRIKVTLPLEEDQLQLSNPNNTSLIPRQATSRIMCATAGLVFAPPLQPWPEGVDRPQRWLRTDLPGIVPYFGAGGDERDVRLWAWLAFLRGAKMILWSNTLPSQPSPDKPADPNELIWFYPGSWFGVDDPAVPSVQLKWLRRAQQDYEYLWLAKQRGEVLNALLMARLITKPVEIQPNQNPDPTYGLMCGTTDPAAWAEARRLIARTILLREPGQEVDPIKRNELNLQTLQWIEPQERPLLLARTSQWLADPLKGMPGEKWVALRVGIDVYNASDATPEQNTLQWTALPEGWQVKPQPMSIPSLETYRVMHFVMDGRFNLDRITPAARTPLEITFTNGYTKRTSGLKVVLPVAASDRREGRLNIDGNLADWDAADLLQDGPLVRMFDRPTIQKQAIQFSQSPAQIYSGWADENFYLAFKLAGIGATDVRFTRNFIDYQFRRAWGEDLAQILIQPVYDDGFTGPILHVVCKPSGSWVERKLDPKTNADPWTTFEGTGVRYAATIESSDWRGEVAIPWKAINDPNRGMPKLLRFNFTQHHATSGETATWAGPVDFGRDDAMMGLIYLREPNTPGMGNVAGPN